MRTKLLYLGLSISLIIAILFIYFLISSKLNQPNDNDAKYAPLNQLMNDFKDHGYYIEIEDVEKSILLGERKWITINKKDNISIYLYKDNEAMEKDSNFVDIHGCTYNNGDEAIDISWVSYPHFYKKDNMIVLYVGEDADILDFLEDQVGKQFAGYETPNRNNKK